MQKFMWFRRLVSPLISRGVVRDNFNRYEEGKLLNQEHWENFLNGENFTVVNDKISKRGKSVFIKAAADSVITKKGVARADGKQVFYVKTKNRANWDLYENGNTQVRVSKGPWAFKEKEQGSPFAAVSFKSDGNVAYYEPVEKVYKNFDSYNDNEWIRLEIEWRSSDKKAKYRVNCGSWTSWLDFAHNDSFIDFDHVGFDFISGGSGGAYFSGLF